MPKGEGKKKSKRSSEEDDVEDLTGAAPVEDAEAEAQAAARTQK